MIRNSIPNLKVGEQIFDKVESKQKGLLELWAEKWVINSVFGETGTSREA